MTKENKEMGETIGEPILLLPILPDTKGCCECTRTFFEGFGDKSCPVAEDGTYSHLFIKDSEGNTLICTEKNRSQEMINAKS